MHIKISQKSFKLVNFEDFTEIFDFMLMSDSFFSNGFALNNPLKNGFFRFC